MDINSFTVVQEVLKWVSKLTPGVYELKNKYQALTSLSIKNKQYKRGDYIFLHPSSFKEGLMKLSNDQKEKEETVRKIKIYLENREKEMPDMEFNSSFTKIRIYPLPANVAQSAE